MVLQKYGTTDIFLFPFAEAHKKYGAMGTMLVIKVGGLKNIACISMCIQMNTDGDMSLFRCILMIHCETHFFHSPSGVMDVMCRFLLNQPASLVSWLLIQQLMNCCIILRNLRLL